MAGFLFEVDDGLLKKKRRREEEKERRREQTAFKRRSTAPRMFRRARTVVGNNMRVVIARRIRSCRARTALGLGVGLGDAAPGQGPRWSKRTVLPFTNIGFRPLRLLSTSMPRKTCSHGRAVAIRRVFPIRTDRERALAQSVKLGPKRRSLPSASVDVHDEMADEVRGRWSRAGRVGVA